MKKPLLLLVFLFLCCSLISASEWIALTPNSPEGAFPEVTVLNCDATRTELSIVIPGFFVEQGSDGLDLYVPGWARLYEVGLPALPYAAPLLGLPAAGPVSLEIAEITQRELDLAPIRPAHEPEFDGQSAQGVEPLSWEGLYPAVATEPGVPGFISNLPVTSVNIHPFRADSHGSLWVATHLVVVVHHDQGNATWPPVTLNDHLVERCSHTVVNFAHVPHVAPARGDAEYLIIVPSNLQSAVQPLADWRRQTGFKTDVRTVSSPSTTTVKNIIKEYPDIEFVLLIGEHTNLPLYSWSGTYGDHWYACTTGGTSPDLYADLSIGRLSGTTTSRITHQVNKILAYEQSPPTGNWLKTTVLVAHKEQYPSKYTACKNDIAGYMASWTNWTCTKYYGGESGKTNAGLSSLVNSGVNVLNYRGHGSTTEWWQWNLSGQSYTNNDVNALNNGAMTPVVFNIACTNADIFSNCLCEAWMDAQGGAVAALGATDPSYTTPNHDFDRKLYTALFQQYIRDIGGMLDYADDYIIANHGWSGETNAKMYIWFGDPATKVWMAIPDEISAFHGKSIGLGSQTFTVTAAANGSALSNATVCLSKDNDVFATAQTNYLGKATFTINPSSAGTMYVTVMEDDYIPYQEIVSVWTTQMVSLSLTPDSTTYRPGQTLGYTADVVNNTAAQQIFYYWCNAVLPNLTLFPNQGSLINPIHVTLAAYGTKSGHAGNKIPNSAPLGNYIFNGYVGPMPTVWDDESFTFQLIP